jgi:4-hydroxybenzoate polyprenyltransferase
MKEAKQANRLIAYLQLARLHQRTGIYLLFLPCLCGIFLAMKIMPQVHLHEILRVSFLFFLGAVFMRSAGCVVNDLIDVNFDRQVSRTRMRPLAAGIISKKAAVIFLVILLIFALAILLQFNKNTIFAGFFILNFVLFYPLMKRITFFPQVFLGITFNFGIVMASLAGLGFIANTHLILYCAFIILTLLYDTIYAFQDIEDDVKIGVKSSAIAFSKRPKLILNFLNILVLILLVFLGFKQQFNWGFFAIIFLAFLIAFIKIILADFKNAQNCLNLFKQAVFFEALIAIAILIG